MALPPSDQSRQLAERVLESIIMHAAYSAELVAGFLEANGLVPPRARRQREPVRLPASFLLELAAVVRLARWEQLGIRDRLPADLPRAASALAALARRWASGLPQGDPPAGPSLSERVMHVWLTHFAWGGLSNLHVDVLLDGAGEGELLEALADFLWDNRRAGPTGQ
jgi:hypothetical protein